MIEEFIKNLREKYSDESLEEKKKKKKKKKDDRCTRIAKRKYKAWPSAYASGAVVRCRAGKIYLNTLALMNNCQKTKSTSKWKKVIWMINHIDPIKMQK